MRFEKPLFALNQFAMAPRRNRRSLIVALLTALAVLPCPPLSAQDEGVALAIVYDTSGSMKDNVRDSAGKESPKHVIARRALDAVLKRLRSFAANASGTPRRMEVGLYGFSSDGARELVRFGPFNSADVESWTRQLPQPNGGTPLGSSLETASRAVLGSKLPRKHVLVITDGMNTVGRDPADVLPRVKQEAERAGGGLSVHFVAFDVKAKVFDRVKKLGATVVEASDEAQLNSQLTFILEKKILLEDEEPPKK
jgi:hypothetical protein